MLNYRTIFDTLAFRLCSNDYNVRLTLQKQEKVEFRAWEKRKNGHSTQATKIVKKFIRNAFDFYREVVQFTRWRTFMSTGSVQLLGFCWRTGASDFKLPAHPPCTHLSLSCSSPTHLFSLNSTVSRCNKTQEDRIDTFWREVVAARTGAKKAIFNSFSRAIEKTFQSVLTEKWLKTASSAYTVFPPLRLCSCLSNYDGQILSRKFNCFASNCYDSRHSEMDAFFESFRKRWRDRKHKKHHMYNTRT